MFAIYLIIRYFPFFPLLTWKSMKSGRTAHLENAPFKGTVMCWRYYFKFRLKMLFYRNRWIL